MKQNKKRKKKIDIKQMDKLDLLMIGVIILLGIYIIFLGFKLGFEVTHKDDTPKAHIVIPIIEKNSSSTITLTMSEFKENSEYIFKVNNYRNNDINSEDINYTINIRNENEADISIYKNDSKKDLVQKEAIFSIENNLLKSNKKQTDIYRVKLNDIDSVKKDSKVRINIES